MVSDACVGGVVVSFVDQVGLEARPMRPTRPESSKPLGLGRPRIWRRRVRAIPGNMATAPTNSAPSSLPQSRSRRLLVWISKDKSQMILAELSPIGLYIFLCSGATEGITEVRVQSDLLSYIQKGAFSIVAQPPAKGVIDDELLWPGPASSDGGIFAFSVKMAGTALEILHLTGRDYTKVESCRRKPVK